jgi:hypothetical protein
MIQQTSNCHCQSVSLPNMSICLLTLDTGPLRGRWQQHRRSCGVFFHMARDDNETSTHHDTTNLICQSVNLSSSCQYVNLSILTPDTPCVWQQHRRRAVFFHMAWM